MIMPAHHLGGGCLSQACVALLQPCGHPHTCVCAMGMCPLRGQGGCAACLGWGGPRTPPARRRKQRHAAQPELLQGLYGLALDHLTRSRAWEGKEHLLDAIANFFEHCCFASASASTTVGGLACRDPRIGGQMDYVYLPRK